LDNLTLVSKDITVEQLKEFREKDIEGFANLLDDKTKIVWKTEDRIHSWVENPKVLGDLIALCLAQIISQVDIDMFDEDKQSDSLSETQDDQKTPGEDKKEDAEETKGEDDGEEEKVEEKKEGEAEKDQDGDEGKTQTDEKAAGDDKAATKDATAMTTTTTTQEVSTKKESTQKTTASTTTTKQKTTKDGTSDDKTQDDTEDDKRQQVILTLMAQDAPFERLSTSFVTLPEAKKQTKTTKTTEGSTDDAIDYANTIFVKTECSAILMFFLAIADVEIRAKLANIQLAQDEAAFLGRTGKDSGIKPELERLHAWMLPHILSEKVTTVQFFKEGGYQGLACLLESQSPYVHEVVSKVIEKSKEFLPEETHKEGLIEAGVESALKKMKVVQKDIDEALKRVVDWLDSVGDDKQTSNGATTDQTKSKVTKDQLGAYAYNASKAQKAA